MRYLIIGSSVAGLVCAKKIKELQKDSEVTILSREETKPYAKMTLPYLLSGEAEEDDVQLEVPHGVKLLLHKPAEQIFPHKKIVATADGKELRFDRLLISSGARAVTLDSEGSDSPRVFTVRDLSDIRKMKTALARSRGYKVIISGAGLVSIEIGEALSKLGYQPIFLASSNKVLSQILDADGSEILRKALVESGAELHFGENVQRVRDDRNGIIVQTEAGREYRGILFVVGKGVSPNIEFLSSSGIVVNRGILVNAFLETNKSDIFAAGDVCQGYDIVHRRRKVNALWPVAVEQGKYAALNMTGLNVPYKGSIARNFVTAFGTTIFTAGLSNDQQCENYRWCQGQKYSKIALRDGKLVGVILINVNAATGVYVFAIENELEISSLKSTMLSGALSYAHFYSFLRKATGHIATFH